MALTFHTETPLAANPRNLVPGKVYATLDTDPISHSERMWVITQVTQTPQKAWRIKTHYWQPPASADDAPPGSPTQELDSYLFFNGWQPTGESKAGPGDDAALSLLEFEAVRVFDPTAVTPPADGADGAARRPRRHPRQQTRVGNPR